MREWWNPAELAEMRLPDMPETRAGVGRKADDENWRRPDLEYPLNKQGLWRRRAGRGGGYEYRYDLLPARARTQLMYLEAGKATPLQDDAALDPETRGMWQWFSGLPEKKQAKARAALAALDTIDALVMAGAKADVAALHVGNECKVSLRTLYNWKKAVAGVERAHRLPYLAPRHAGSMERVECSPEAWDALKADWLRKEAPTFEACFRRLERAAKAHGWILPSANTLRRRLDALPPAIVVLARKGEEELKKLYPAQERRRDVFHALEAVNADGHKWDVFVRWPDGEIARPIMTAFQDLFSGKILSWRIDRSENREAVRLAFGDLVEMYGIPDHCWLDNGRNFASKQITGGARNRFRFKLRDEEPAGIMPTLGVEVHFTKPYSGQSKPIERAFRDFAGDVAKHPAFAGAYTGHKTDAKPENYGSHAVPLEQFIAVIAAEIAEHNARPGRRTHVCAGKHSFDDVFLASYAASPIRKATPEQRRMWLLAAEGVKVRGDGSIHLMGNRYWSDLLTGLRRSSVIVRFDPQAMHDGIHVYRLDGGYVGHAECWEAAGFDSVDKARAHERARRDYINAQKRMLAAECKLSLPELAALQAASSEPSPLPETKVVRPVFGNTALKPQAAVANDIEQHEQMDMDAFGRSVRMLRLVRDENGGADI